jgi:hypothetical protein
VYNRVYVKLTTHEDRITKQSGLSQLDLKMARHCDEQAKELGAVFEETSAADTERMREIVVKLQT